MEVLQRMGGRLYQGDPMAMDGGGGGGGGGGGLVGCGGMDYLSYLWELNANSVSHFCIFGVFDFLKSFVCVIH